MIVALIEINCYLILLSIVYFLLRGYLKVSSRRLMVLLIPIISALIFVLKLLVGFNGAEIIVPMIELDLVSIGAGITSNSKSDIAMVTPLNFYCLGLVLFSLLVFYKLVKLFFFFKGAVYSQKLKAFILKTTRKESFTFFNKIHLSHSLDKDDQKIVLEHELLHIRYKHTWDLVLMAFYHISLWFNPALFFLKKELKYIHEYQVDRTMYVKHEKKYLKHLLASAMGVSSSQLLTSQFYNGLSLTQRTKHMKTKFENNWKLVAVIPAFALGLSFISFTTKSPVFNKMEVVAQDTIYDVCETLPSFPGGVNEMIKFISDEVKYPKKEKDQGVTGTVYIGFIVQENGKIKDVKSLKKINKAFEAEAERVIKLMPNWIPGEHEGEKVNVRYTMPINFQLKS